MQSGNRSTQTNSTGWLQSGSTRSNGGHQTLNEFDGNDIQKNKNKKKRDKEQTLQVQMVVRDEENRTTCKQHTWTQTADTKHVKGEKAIYLLSHT